MRFGGSCALDHKVGLPITHAIFIDLTFESDDSAGEHGSINRNSPIVHFAHARRLDRLEERTVPIENVGTATGEHGRYVVRLNESIEGAFERFRSELRT